jgi:hypothetical protein
MSKCTGELRAIAFFFIALLPLVGCGGSGTTGGPAQPMTRTQPQAVQTKATLQLRIPTATAMSGAARRPQFVGAAVGGVQIQFFLHSDTGHTTAVGGGVFDVSATSTFCTPASGVRVCTLPVTTVTGTEDVVVSTYTQPPVSFSFNGAVELGVGIVYAVQVLANSANTINVAVGGIVATMTLLPASQSLAGNAAGNYVLDLTAYDASGEMIIAGTSTVVNGGTSETDTYSNPITIAVHETGGSGHAMLSLNGGAHATSVLVQTSSSTITVYYDGAASAGYTATFTASATSATSVNSTLALAFGASIYVANTNASNVLGFPPISPACTVAAPCTLGAAPTVTLTTPGLSTGVALDGAGVIYVVNYYPIDTETVYPANANGTTAALETITGMTDPEFIAVDASGRIYVSSYAQGQLNVYAAVSAGCTSAAPCAVSSPIATISNYGSWSVAVDASGRVYLASRDLGLVDVYAAIPLTCTTVSPCNISGSATVATIGTGDTSVGLVAVDGTGRVFFTTNFPAGILVYPAVPGSCTTANPCAMTTSLAQINAGTGYIALDANGNIYQTEIGNSVAVYPPVSASCTIANPCSFTATPFATISGPNTQINGAQGIAVR